MLWWILAACSGGDGSCVDGTCPTDDPPTDAPTHETGATTPTGTVEETGTPGHSATVPDLCEADPSLSVTAVTTADGPMSTSRKVLVTTSAPATVAVRCTKTDDPDEVHFLEDAAASTDHEFRFGGLLPDASYTCQAAPTCPTLEGGPTAVTVTTGPVPEVLPQARVTVDPKLGMTGAWTVMNFQDGACVADDTPWLIAFDPEGTPRWWKAFPAGITGDIEALWHPEDDSIVWGGGYSTLGRCHVSPMWADDTYACDLLPDVEDTIFHHDTKRLPDGRILTLESRVNTHGLNVWSGFGVRLHDPATGRVDLEIDSQRYVDEGILPDGSVTNLEPYHANAVELYQQPGKPDRLYVSLCFNHSILAIEPTDGSVRWNLEKGAGWSVVDAAGQALGQDMLPECQHGMDVLGDDHLLLYDNGQLRHASQITDLSIDPVAKKVTVNWQWTDGWYEDTLGDVDDLHNGRVLIDQAHPECWSQAPPGARTKVLEVVRATGEIAAQLELPRASHTSYRAQRYDGCEFLPGTRFCATAMTRLQQVQPLFER